MLIRLLVLLAAIAPYTFADVQFTSPSAGAQETGGSTLKVAWKESGTGPKLSSFTTYQLFLCAGGNDPSSFVRTKPARLQMPFGLVFTFADANNRRSNSLRSLQMGYSVQGTPLQEPYQ